MGMCYKDASTKQKRKEGIQLEGILSNQEGLGVWLGSFQETELQK